MDVFVFVLSVVVLAFVWRWIANKLHEQHWIVRHLAGFCSGILVLALVVDIAGGLGLVDTAPKAPAHNGNDNNESIADIYTISNDVETPFKRTVDVILQSRVSEADLEKIAHLIKGAEKREYKNTFIGYRLKNQPPESSYWATTHYTPELQVIIQGLSARQYDHFKNLPLTEQFPGLVGSWIIESGFNYLTALHVSDGKLYIEEIHTDNSQGRTEYAFDLEPDGVVRLFEPDHIENESNDYYTLGEDGVLRSWDGEGKIDSLPSRDGAVDLSRIAQAKDIADWAPYVPPPPSDEVAAIASKYTSLFTEYLSMGVGMERVRGEAICMDKMRTYKPAFKIVSEDFSKAIQSLPANKRFNDVFEPLYSAQVDLSWCLNCTNTAMASCISAAKALGVDY